MKPDDPALPPMSLGLNPTQYGSENYGVLERLPPFVGRPPKNYLRFDDRIYEDVCERLTQDPKIDASHIEVRVKDGIVHLSGMVDSREQKRYAEDCVEKIRGVRDIENKIRYNRMGLRRLQSFLQSRWPSGH